MGSFKLTLPVFLDVSLLLSNAGLASPGLQIEVKYAATDQHLQRTGRASNTILQCTSGIYMTPLLKRSVSARLGDRNVAHIMVIDN